MNVEEIQKILNDGIDLTYPCHAELPVIAAYYTTNKIFEQLWKNGMYIHSNNTFYGFNALYVACTQGKKENAFFLMDQGMDINQVSKNQFLPPFAATLEKLRSLSHCYGYPDYDDYERFFLELVKRGGDVRLLNKVNFMGIPIDTTKKIVNTFLHYNVGKIMMK